MRTLNQDRAKFALDEINEIKKEGKNKAKKYKTNARRLPALITTNGLIATLAFLNSKDETKPVYKSVVKWLKERKYIKQEENGLRELLEVDYHKLRLATMEALALANWLKRIVEIEIEGEDE